MVATPPDRLPLPTDDPVIGWTDTYENTRVAVDKSAIRCLMVSGGPGYKPVLDEATGVITVEQVNYYTVVATTVGGYQSGPVIVLKKFDTAEERDTWLQDNATSWLGA